MGSLVVSSSPDIVSMSIVSELASVDSMKLISKRQQRQV